MDLDLHISRFDWAGSPENIASSVRELAQCGEATGVRTLSFMDHYYQMDWMAPAEDPMLEGYTALGFVAGCTQKLRLRLLVTGVTYRHPGLLAKVVTTLDVLSSGRAELGIGAAWYEREHVGLGVPFPPIAERFERLEETLQICQQMWSEDDGPYMGKHYELAATICRPEPVSKPRPRILIGGGGEKKTLRLVAQYGDACNLMGTPEIIEHKIKVLKEHCKKVGRDPGEIEITILWRNLPEEPNTSDIVKSAEEWAALGVRALVVGVEGDSPARLLESRYGPVIERLKEINPKLA